MSRYNVAHLYAGVGAVALLAASLDGGAARAADAKSGGAIAEVVVTAQRRSESAQNVPIAITAVSAQTLANAGVRSYPDIAALTPGLQFQAIGATSMPFLRGVGATTSAAGQEGGVALYVDDVYFPSGPASMMSLNNVDNVAVLRGPQGTLFGRNATGGVVQITTRKPGQKKVFDGSIGYGNHQTVDGGFYASTPLTDRIAADLAFYGRDNRGGWGRNLGTGQRNFVGKDLALRSRWEFELAPDTQLTLIGQYFRVKTQNGFSSTRLNPGELGQNERYNGGVIATEGFYNVDLNDTSGASTTVKGASAKLTHAFGFADFTSISAFTRMRDVAAVDFDFTSNPGGTLLAPNPQEDTYSQEFQLASKNSETSPFSWVTGAYLYKDDARYRNQVTIARGVNTQHLNTRQDTKSWSVFAQGGYKLTESTHLTLGIRYNRDERKFAGTNLVVPVAGPSVLSPSSGSATYPATTYKVGIDHKFSEDVMAYASYTTGFKSGFFGTQALQTVPGHPTIALPVRPEEIKSVEVGVKSILLDHSLRMNVSAFHYDYTNLQVNAFINATTRVVLNAGGAKIYGVDFDGEWHPTDSLYFTLAAEALHTEYTSFANAPFFTPRVAAPWGLVASIGNAKGNKLTNSPEFTSTLGANYKVPLMDGQLSFNGSAFYNSGFYFEPMNRIHQPSYVLFNGTIKWTAPGAHYDISLWGANLSDRRVFSSVNPTAGGDAGEPKEPRTFGVRLGVHY